jgi:hypothetical protein
MYFGMERFASFAAKGELLLPAWSRTEPVMRQQLGSSRKGNAWVEFVTRRFVRRFPAQNNRTWESAGLTEFLRALAFLARLNGVQGNAMPPTRRHPQYSRNSAPAADAHTTAGDQLAGQGSCAEGGDFIEQTIAIWQKRTDRKLTREDAREIIENITGFFTILHEWERKERTAGCAKRAVSAPDSHVIRQTKQNKDEAGLSSKPVKAEI